MDAGLVQGEGFAVETSDIKEGASRQRGALVDDEINWSDSLLNICAVREHFAVLDERRSG